MTEAIEAQIERFAPGFRDLVLARHAMGPAGDGGAQPATTSAATSTAGGGPAPAVRPPGSARRVPYATPDPRLFICSSSTPPGGGVHGMCGWLAARAALRGILR